LLIPKAVRRGHGWEAGVEWIVEDRGDPVVLPPARFVARTEVNKVRGGTGYRGARRTLEEMEAAIAKGARGRGSRWIPTWRSGSSPTTTPDRQPARQADRARRSISPSGGGGERLGPAPWLRPGGRGHPHRHRATPWPRAPHRGGGRRSTRRSRKTARGSISPPPSTSPRPAGRTPLPPSIRACAPGRNACRWPPPRGVAP